MRSWSRADVHATWHDGAVCLWTWDDGPGRSAPLNALYADVYAGRPSGRIGSVGLVIPGLGPATVPCVHWPARGAVEAMAGRPRSPSWSPSVSWIHRAVVTATAAVGSRRVLPESTDGRGRARWKLVPDDRVRTALAELEATMPPVLRAAGPARAADILDAFADAAARSGLRAVHWKPPADGRRDSVGRVVRSAFRSLSDDPNTPPLVDADPSVIRELGRWFAEEQSRLLDEPMVRARLRMVPPEEHDGDWKFVLEAVDAGDRGHWCTAADVAAGAPAAVEVAGRAEHLAVVGAALDAAGRVLAATVPAFAPFALGTAEPVGLDLEAVGDVLEAAHLLDEAGVELLGPEQLVRTAVRLAVTARPAPAGGRPGGLDAAALVSWTAQVDDVPVDLAELERAEAAGASLMQVGGRWVRIDRAQVRKVLQALDVHQTDGEELTPARLLKLAAEPDDDIVVTGSGWAADLLAGLPDDRLEETMEPAGFGGELRHYQRRGLAWLTFLARLGLGGCLADDMGLGKTATTLAHLLDRPGPHLVVCPLSVVRNWETESARFAPALHVVVHHGGDRVQGDDAVGHLSSHDLVVTTYGVLTREIGTLADVAWSTVVLDEAQSVKNPNTRAAKAVRKLHAAQRLALTGTPIENRLSELWSILDAVNPGLLGSLSKFQSTFANPIERNHDLEAAERLRRLTAPFLLRRTKADKTLLPDLPDKVEQVAWASLTKEQGAMYQAVVDQLLEDATKESGMRRRGLVLASLTRLKQICNHPAHALGDGSRLSGRSGKLARFDELVEELLDAEERALIFTQYREMGELLVRHLADHLGIVVPFLHGGVARTQRDHMVERFQDGSGPPLLLVSLKAGGTGLNLTAASRVIHYDRWWNPAVEDQATDRAWRLGQQRTVFVHKLVCTGTLEERIGQLIDEKRSLATAVVGTTGEAWLSELSTDQLRDLVVLDRSAVER